MEQAMADQEKSDERHEDVTSESDAEKKAPNRGVEPGEDFPGAHFNGHEGPLADVTAPEDAILPPEESETIQDFAETVMFGLENAGLDKAPEQERPSEYAQAEVKFSATESEIVSAEDTFFAGWDGLDPDSEARDIASALDFPIHEEALVLGQGDRQPTLESLGSLERDTATKHDALADAVQSALQSVYGDTPPPPQPNAITEPEVRKPEASLFPSSASAVIDDGLSPQDVILNYFSYKSGSEADPIPFDAEEEEPAPVRQASSDVGARFGSFPRDNAAPRESIVANDQAPRTFSQFGAAAAASRSSPQPAMRYEGPPSFPVPAATARSQKTGQTAARDNGRLLGAAGIGLVGGIGIAATLAVFVINSYGPQSQKLVSQTDQGYGTGERAPSTAMAMGNQRVDGAALDEADIRADDVSGASGQPVGLRISVNTGHPAEQTLVSITGIPAGGRLNSGIDAGNGNWLLPRRRLAGLSLTVPYEIRDAVPLEVQLLDSNLRTPLSGKKQFLVSIAPPAPAATQGEQPRGASTPATLRQAAALSPSSPNQAVPAFNTQTMAAGAEPIKPAAQPAQQPKETTFKTQTVRTPPPRTAPSGPAIAALVPAPAGARIPQDNDAAKRRAALQPEIEDLIREGNKHMREGDIKQAREFYAKAVTMGDPEAALAMGRSFDPIYFERLDKKNADPDPAKAFDWYKTAMDSGANQTAKVRIDNLKQYLNR